MAESASCSHPRKGAAYSEKSGISARGDKGKRTEHRHSMERICQHTRAHNPALGRKCYEKPHRIRARFNIRFRHMKRFYPDSTLHFRYLKRGLKRKKTASTPLQRPDAVENAFSGGFKRAPLRAANSNLGHFLCSMNIFKVTLCDGPHKGGRINPPPLCGFS